MANSENIDFEKKIDLFKSWIEESQKTVFFGGAGVSTESGIPDFRGAEGIYRKSGTVVPPEKILSHSFFAMHPIEFFEFYKKNMIYKDAEPGETHKKLAELEEIGKLDCVITQNIDGLHQKAGSKSVIELHGSVYRNYCIKCGMPHDVDRVINAEGVPFCDCGGVIKPDVVLYGEELNNQDMVDSVKAVSEAELLIIGGTSLGVYPAAGLIRMFAGKHIVLINLEPTSFDSSADLVFNNKIGEVFNCI